jgi:uroporphyrinogen decarboxylase
MFGSKKILQALSGKAFDIPPVWMMRQAGRYLPEYRATRAKAGDFLSLCYNPELAAEVTLQPIKRFQFDAAIIFADILLIPQALGADLWFVEGEGPRLSTINSTEDLLKLRSPDAIHEVLNPIYETVKLVSRELPKDTALIGFAGAPWTVATYMIAGKGTPDQKPAHELMSKDLKTFESLINLLTKVTIEYLSMQIKAGAEVIKIFDSWAGSLKADQFVRYSLEPIKEIIAALKARHPNIPIIAFPRQANKQYIGFAKNTGANCIAIDNSITPSWARKYLQVDGCVQGNLDPRHMVTGGVKLVEETKKIISAFSGGPHIFNLGHGITPDANPDHVQLMIDTIRG